MELFSEGSLTGWVSVLGDQKAHEFWTQKERKCHINRLELLAAFFCIEVLS